MIVDYLLKGASLISNKIILFECKNELFWLFTDWRIATINGENVSILTKTSTNDPCQSSETFYFHLSIDKDQNDQQTQI